MSAWKLEVLGNLNLNEGVEILKGKNMGKWLIGFESGGKEAWFKNINLNP